MSDRFDKVRRYAPTALGALFAASGATHFVRPETFTAMVPNLLPSPEGVVYASGAAELLCAAGLLSRQEWSAPASAALLALVFPAHVQMLLDFRKKYGTFSWPTAVALARMPLQIPLVWAALQVRRS